MRNNYHIKFKNSISFSGYDCVFYDIIVTKINFIINPLRDLQLFLITNNFCNCKSLSHMRLFKSVLCVHVHIYTCIEKITKT